MKRRPYTQQEIDYIKEHYPTTLNRDICIALGRTEGSIGSVSLRLGLKKDKVYLQKLKTGEIGNSAKTMFTKGNASWNKGLKGLTNKSSTKFKKGHIPHNAKESDGAISIRKDKNGTCYRFIRVALGKWYHYGRWVWEEKNGKIPKGMCLWHIDRDSLNDNIENLEVITRRDNIKRNSIVNYTHEQRSILKIISKINKKVSSHEKHK